MKNCNAGKILTLAGCMLLVAGCGGSRLLPHASEGSSASFQTYQDVEDAVAAIKPGTTTTAELAKIGFDVKTAPNIEVLSYLGVLDRMSQDTRGKGALPAPVQACLDSHERCTAFVFRPQRIEAHHVGNTLLDLTGFERDTVSSGWSAEVMLLIKDDVVVYKLMSGRPRIEEMRHTVQPLGPLQNVGGAIVGGGSRPDPKN